jgi:hypothetical protein
MKNVKEKEKQGVFWERMDGESPLKPPSPPPSLQERGNDEATTLL